MVYQDPRIKEPLNKINSDLKQLEENLVSVQIVIKELIQHFPFTKENKKKCLKILKGGFFTMFGVGTLSKKITGIGKLEGDLNTNIIALNDYLRSGGPKSRAGEFLDAHTYWINNAKKVATYRAAIIKYLSWADDSIVYQALRQEPIGQVSLEDLNNLDRYVTGFLTLVNKLKGHIEVYLGKYQAGGIDAVNKAEVRTLAQAK